MILRVPHNPSPLNRLELSDYLRRSWSRLRRRDRRLERAPVSTTVLAKDIKNIIIPRRPHRLPVRESHRHHEHLVVYYIVCVVLNAGLFGVVWGFFPETRGYSLEENGRLQRYLKVTGLLS